MLAIGLGPIVTAPSAAATAGGPTFTPSIWFTMLPSGQTIMHEELLRRGNELQNRERHLQGQRDALIAQRTELAHQNTLRKRIAGFSAQVGAAADDLDFEQRQKLLRLVVEHVFVRGWRVEIQLRIPLDEPSTPPDRGMSSKDCLRSLGIEDVDVMGQPIEQHAGQALGECRRSLI